MKVKFIWYCNVVAEDREISKCCRRKLVGDNFEIARIVISGCYPEPSMPSLMSPGWKIVGLGHWDKIETDIICCFKGINIYNYVTNGNFPLCLET